MLKLSTQSEQTSVVYSKESFSHSVCILNNGVIFMNLVMMYLIRWHLQCVCRDVSRLVWTDTLLVTGIFGSRDSRLVRTRHVRYMLYCLFYFILIGWGESHNFLLFSNLFIYFILFFRIPHF